VVLFYYLPMDSTTPIITILATEATDKIINGQGSRIAIREGGPAFYLKRVFRKEKISFTAPFPPYIEVEIHLTEKGEVGRVENRPSPIQVNFGKITTPFLVISTILDDFGLEGISAYQGKIFLDVQGYVRDGNHFSGKKKWRPPQEFVNSCFCLKGTSEEMSYLPDIFEEQKQKLLILTKGENGCEFFYEGVAYSIAPHSIVKTPHAIGAGDTLFGYFISQFLKTKNPLLSIHYAMSQTVKFLSGCKDVLDK